MPTTLLKSRFNDGKCDKRGRFFVGSMSNVKPRITGKGGTLGHKTALILQLACGALKKVLGSEKWKRWAQ